MNAGAQEDRGTRHGGERPTRPHRREGSSRDEGRRTRPNAHSDRGARAGERRSREGSRPARSPRAEARAPRQTSRQSPRKKASQSLPSRTLQGVVRHRRLLIALGIVAVVILALYGPVQRYYVAWRTQGDEQARADYLNGDNDALKQDIDRLTTRSGVENEARERGYRYPSEDANASANGNDSASADANASADNANQGSNALDSGFSYDDIEHPWYVHVLDVVFAYSSPQD